jgi:malate synthase
MVEGQINLRDAVRRSIAFEQGGKPYRLNESTAVLIPRPRGWHLDEKHLRVDGRPVSGAIFDFALYFFHNARELVARGTGPYFYLPKMESHLEARLWNDIFRRAQSMVGVPQGTIKATALIETVLAAFEMDEILWELKDHSAGLNIGRWDYIFSCIKKFRSRRDFCLADRAQVTMTSPFMRAYALLLVKTCHRRGAPAMGGMAAQIPIKNDAAANAAAMEKVRQDKLREVTDGCDGTWVAHPGLVPVAKEVFDRHMPQPNQYGRQRPDVQVSAADLLRFEPEEPITEAGLRNNISVGIQYLGAWLAGNGCVPVFNLMEDAATAEISRSQIWQWIRSEKGVLQDGRKVTKDLFRELLREELPKVQAALGAAAWQAGRYQEAASLFERITTDDDYVEFLTLPAYELID